MSKRTLLCLVLTLATAGSGSWAWLERSRSEAREEQAAFDRKRLALLEEENGRLREVAALYERGKKEAAEAQRRGTIEKLTAEIRGLEFKKPVDYDVVTRDGIDKVLHGLFSEQFSDDEFEAMRLGYVAVGLLPADFPFREKYLELLSEQVAAFYDQHRHRLYMFADATLENAQNRVILSHELTHALQDQHFDLKKLPLLLKTNDDRVMAAMSLIEGDATLQMQVFMMREMSAKGFGQSLGAMFTQNMEKLAAAPRILRETLLFPYTKGLDFCIALQRHQGDFAGISEAYRRVPASTTQILHPEKYFAREEPVPVRWPDLNVLGEKPLFDNVLGEFATGVLLAEWAGPEGSNAAQGWRGDRYLVYQKGKALIWRTLWENEAAAERFSKALTELLAKRYQAVREPGTADTGLTRFSAKDRVVRVIRRPGTSDPALAEVILIDTHEARWADAFAEKFAQ